MIWIDGFFNDDQDCSELIFNCFPVGFVFAALTSVWQDPDQLESACQEDAPAAQEQPDLESAASKIKKQKSKTKLSEDLTPKGDKNKPRDQEKTISVNNAAKKKTTSKVESNPDEDSDAIPVPTKQAKKRPVQTQKSEATSAKKAKTDETASSVESDSDSSSSSSPKHEKAKEKAKDKKAMDKKADKDQKASSSTKTGRTRTTGKAGTGCSKCRYSATGCKRCNPQKRS